LPVEVFGSSPNSISLGALNPDGRLEHIGVADECALDLDRRDVVGDGGGDFGGGDGGGGDF